MSKRITLFLPAAKPEDLATTLNEINLSGQVENIYILVAEGNPMLELPAGTRRINVPALHSAETIRKIASHAHSDFVVLYTKHRALKLGAFALQRMIQVAEYTKAGMVYSDYLALKEEKLVPNPLIDYQLGSLRDDFNFGSLMLFETLAVIEAASRMKEHYSHAGLYDLRLKISQKHNIVHIPELLYTEVETDARRSGEKLFDYVDPRNRQVQLEMEQACTAHLRDTGAWLEPRFKQVRFEDQDSGVEASVIIPVRNRARTIGDAIRSALDQKTGFVFNLIVVDNHSTDGTGDIVASMARKDPRLIHVIPERNDLGIGGCWNEAIFHPACGKFAVQLDSDDMYIDNTVLARMVEAFYGQRCAMLVGSYRMVNFDLREIPPGLIDHREWTPENGRNNALRINGLGAPRAFYTPVIRDVRFPNVSYGEDYAVGLNICRYYLIGRLYEPLYLCRRWEENSDASLDAQKLNDHNFYKDKIRTIELSARQQYINEGQVV